MARAGLGHRVVGELPHRRPHQTGLKTIYLQARGPDRNGAAHILSFGNRFHGLNYVWAANGNPAVGLAPLTAIDRPIPTT